MTAWIINSEMSLQSAEEWRDIPGLEGRYQASSLGRIRSLDRVGKTCYGATRRLKGRIVAQKAGKSGYVRISSGIAETQFVHRLIALAFVPNPKDLPVINHIDGNKSNNLPENLEWCTQADNVRHGFNTGLTPFKKLFKGDLSISAKLTEAKVAQIKYRLSRGERSIDLAREYGVVKGTIGEIKAGRSWGHVNAASY